MNKFKNREENKPICGITRVSSYPKLKASSSVGFSPVASLGFSSQSAANVVTYSGVQRNGNKSNGGFPRAFSKNESSLAGWFLCSEKEEVGG
jgi:hypothetical protein